jgi:hypothetical protein
MSPNGSLTFVHLEDEVVAHRAGVDPYLLRVVHECIRAVHEAAPAVFHIVRGREHDRVLRGERAERAHGIRVLALVRRDLEGSHGGGEVRVRDHAKLLAV